MKFIKNKKSGYVNIMGIVGLVVISITISMLYLFITKEKPIKNYMESTTMSVEEVEVEKVIYDEGYETTTLTMVDDKGTFIPITNTYPDTFTTIFKHNDHTHSISSKKIYDLYKDKIGEKVKANVNTNTYKNGEEKHTIDIILN